MSDDANVLDDVEIGAGEPWGRELKAGERLRIVDLEGSQAVDFLCYDAHDRHDRYNASNTMKMGANIFITHGSTLWSDRGKALMRVVADTCGFHDTIGGCCSAEMNTLRYGADGPGNCRDTFERALAPFGLSRDDIVTNINWFMYVPISSKGKMGMGAGLSKPGDHVELVAERDVVCVISNCTQIYNPVNDFKPTPVRIIVFGAGR